MSKIIFIKLKKIFITFLLTGVISAQETESIQTDRPDQNETPVLTPLKMIQVETGFSCEKSNKDETNVVIPSILWKYGISENFEVRLITEFVRNESFSNKTSGINPILIGFKVKLIKEDGIIPKTSFISHLAMSNVSSTSFKLDFAAPQFRFAMQHSLSKKMSLIILKTNFASC